MSEDEHVAHCMSMARLDVNYARYAARMAARRHPSQNAGVPARLDAALQEAGIAIPAEWTGIVPSRIPVQPTNGPRVFDTRSFLDRLKNGQ